jgi:O-antigen ligase
MYAMVYPGGKGPVLMLMITVVVMAACHLRPSVGLKSSFSKRIIKYPLVVLALGGGVLAALVFLSDFSALIQRTSFVLTNDHYSNVERVNNISVALNLFFQHPFLGIGIGGFSMHAVHLEGIDSFLYPHNILLELLAELGLVGFLLFSSLLISAVLHLVTLQRKFPQSSLPNVFLGLLVFTFLNALTSQDLTNPALFSFIGFSFVLGRHLTCSPERGH